MLQSWQRPDSRSESRSELRPESRLESRTESPVSLMPAGLVNLLADRQQFLDVVSQHKKLLELTVYNCDLAVRCIGIIEELVAEGCNAIKARYDKTNQELADMRIDVHKEHLEYFRVLYLALGNLIYKKEKRLEEIDRNIRTTHIQLEFCVETFDPNAKKHSDMKKELYKLRQQVEEIDDRSADASPVEIPPHY